MRPQLLFHPFCASLIAACGSRPARTRLATQTAHVWWGSAYYTLCDHLPPHSHPSQPARRVAGPPTAPAYKVSTVLPLSLPYARLTLRHSPRRWAWPAPAPTV